MVTAPFLVTRAETTSRINDCIYDSGISEKTPRCTTCGSLRIRATVLARCIVPCCGCDDVLAERGFPFRGHSEIISYKRELYRMT